MIISCKRAISRVRNSLVISLLYLPGVGCKRFSTNGYKIQWSFIIIFVLFLAENAFLNGAHRRIQLAL